MLYTDQPILYPINDVWLFGDGSDGDISLGTVTLADNQYLRNGTITGTVTVRGFGIYGTFGIRVDATGIISAKGNDAALNVQGSVTFSNWTGGGPAGGAGNTAAGSAGGSGTACLGGAGGAGGAGVNAAGAAGTRTLAVVNSGVSSDAVVRLGVQAGMGNAVGSITPTRWTGGSGGGGGGGNGTGRGGGGGAAGGVVIVCAPYIVNEGSINANGGTGGTPTSAGAGAQGGGGGGGGGAVLTTSRQTSIPGSGTITATRGLGGAGQQGGASGNDGNDGLVRHQQLHNAP